MSCCSSSPRRFLAGVVVVAALGPALTLAGCSSSPPADDETSQDFLPRELAILGSGNRDQVVDAVARFGGTITVEVPQTETYQASFPITTLQELIEIRDALRGEGLSATLVPTIDPFEQP